MTPRKDVPLRQRYEWGKITKRKYDYRVDFWWTPKQKESEVCLTRQDAEEILEYFQSQATGANVPKDQRTVAMYLELHHRNLKGLERESLEKYEYERAPVIELLGHIKACELSLEDIREAWAVMLEPDDYDDEPAYSIDAVMRARRHLINALDLAVDDEVVQSNVAARPSAKPARKRTKKKQEAWTAKEAMRFLRTAKDHEYYSAYYLFLSTGLRRGELLALRWRNFDLQAGTIKIEESYTGYRFKPPKTPAAHRTFRVPKALVQHFADRKLELANMGLGVEENDLVFPGSTGRPISPHKLLSELKKLAQAAGVPQRTCHELRHTFVYLSSRAGISRLVLMRRLGHENEHEML